MQSPSISTHPYRNLHYPKIRQGSLSQILFDFYCRGIIKLTEERIQSYIKKRTKEALRHYICVNFRASLKEVLLAIYLSANDCVLPIGNREDFEVAKFSIEKKQSELTEIFSPNDSELISALLLEMLQGDELTAYNFDIYRALVAK